MSALQMKRHGRQLLKAIERGLNAPPRFPPKYERPEDDYLIRLEVLKDWRKATARKMGVNSDVVLPRDLLYEIAEKNPRSPKRLGEILREVPWRLENFGEQILYLMHKT